MESEFDVLHYLNDLENENKEKWEMTSVTDVNEINIERIYSQKPHWMKITGGIVAVYTDMVNSSAVNVTQYRHNLQRGRIFDIFTGGLVKIFHDFEVVHIDIEGDGVLGIWNGGIDRYKAFCAAVTVRTYIGDWLTDFVSKQVKDLDKIDVRVGIDEEKAIVKYVGVRGDDKNLVWAGGPVTNAAKLCKLHTFKDNSGSEIDPKSHIAVSDRFYEKICNIEEIEKSCGCSDGEFTGEKTYLWKSYPVPEDKREALDFENYSVLLSQWCARCGTDYCRKILGNVEIRG